MNAFGIGYGRDMNGEDKKYFEKYLDAKFESINKQLENIRSQIKNIKLTASIVGGIGGVLAAIATYLGFNR